MKWRLGLDLGTNSIGWAAFKLTNDPQDKMKLECSELLDLGVRIFHDSREPSSNGRVGESLAVQRRMARGMRRNRDRTLNRYRKLMRLLIEFGLMPDTSSERESLKYLNPYQMRAEAVDRVISPYELGRALLHLGKRRGFKSNRKTDTDDKETGKIKEGIKELRDTLEGQTLGQYLWKKYQNNLSGEKSGRVQGIRFRAEDPFFPDRDMYAREFDAIRSMQEHAHNLSHDQWDRIKEECILFQHPLKPIERGRCYFFPDEYRAWADTPIAHEYRIWQELNNLQWRDEEGKAHGLMAHQRDAISELMFQQNEVSFSKIKKLKDKEGKLLFPDIVEFNLESEKRKSLKGHTIAARIAKDPTLNSLWSILGNQWNDIFEALHQASDDEEAEKNLERIYSFSPEQIKSLLHFHLSPGTQNVSRKFMEKIIPIMRDQGIRYDEAVLEVTDDDDNPLHHSLSTIKAEYDFLPYYGEILQGALYGGHPEKCSPEENPEIHFGKIGNPTVHVALNQLRRLVNALVERWGKPYQMHVEVGRDLKLPKKRREEIEREQAKNQKENEKIKDELLAGGIIGVSRADILKWKLWEELGKDQLLRTCVYTGETISMNQLINGDQVEIEHILPFSRTLDDSRANKTVSKTWANKLKGNKTPYEAFGNNQHADKGIVWEEILERAAKLPQNKRWRFFPEAIHRYEKDNSFIARQLTDNAYISRVSAKYLSCLVPYNKIVMMSGQMTGMVRGKWRLNEMLPKPIVDGKVDDNWKSRDDHRHHAVDAFTLSMMDRSLLQEISRISGRRPTGIFDIELPLPDTGLVEKAKQRLSEIYISYKPDHGHLGRMFMETAYGVVDEKLLDPEFPDYKLVTRKEVASLSDKEILHIRGKALRTRIQQAVRRGAEKGLKPAESLKRFSAKTGIKKVRVWVSNKSAQNIPTAPWKAYAMESYVCCDIWKIPRGKPEKWKKDEFKWQGIFWSYAETVGGDPDKNLKKPHPAAKFEMRLYKLDTVMTRDGKVYLVAGYDTQKNKLDIRNLIEAHSKQKHVSINVLGEKGLKKIFITVDGRIKSKYQMDKQVW